MTEGVVKMVILSITIVFLAAVIGILASGAIGAKEIASDGSSYFHAGTQPESINVEMLSDRSMPISAIAAILRRNKDSINSLACGICGDTTMGDDMGACLKSHLSGRGVLTFIQDIDGGYIVMLTGDL